MKSVIYFLLYLIFILNQSAAQVFSDMLEDAIRSANPGEKIRAVIKMNGEIDVEDLKARTEGISKSEARAVVIAEFDNIVQTYQKDLLDYLVIMKDEGNVDNFISIAITNKIVIEATTDVFEEIRSRDDFEIAYIETPQPVLLDNTWNVEKINAHIVWNSLGFTGQDIIIAILDTGTDWKHSDLVGNIWQNLGEDANGNGATIIWNGTDWVFDPGDLNGIDDDDWDNDPTTYIDDLIGWNFVHNNNNTLDDEGHGTIVAGLISGNGSGGTHTGVAPSSKIMTLKVFDFQGKGVPSSVLAALEYTIINGAEVTNSSFGWRYDWYDPGSPDDPRPYFRMAYDIVAMAGIVNIVAAGNDGGHSPNPPVPHNIRTPGDVPSVITVGGTDINDDLYYDSSIGPVTWSDVPQYGDYLYPPGLLKPDISAPAIGIISTQRGGGYFYDYDGGTSWAAPHVAGTVALLLEANPTLLPSQVKNILERTSFDLGDFGKDPFYGSGRIDALNSTVVYKSKSINSDATGLNGGRRIVKDSNNHYHLVFGSGNNIWYRKSTDGGNSWSSPELLYIVAGKNNYPSIAYHNNFLFVTWQQYLGYENNEHLYRIEGVYKQLSDNLWSPMLITGGDISFSTQINPLPVIVAADNVDDNYNSADNAPEVMIVFRKADGIYHSNLFYSIHQENEAMFTYQQLSSTSKIGNTAAGYSNPSIAINNYEIEQIIVTCQSPAGTMHAYRTTGGGWASYLSSIFNSLYFNDYKNSSVTTNVTNDFHIVWEGTDDALRKAILHKKITYQGWPSGPVSEFIDNNSTRPSVYGHTDVDYGLSIFWHNNTNIRKVVYDESGWGRFQNVKLDAVHVNAINKDNYWRDVFSWTGTQGPLYNYGVNFNPDVPKQNSNNLRGDDSIQVLTYRKAELRNEQLNIAISLQIGNFKLITQNGEEYPLDLELLEPDFSFTALGDILSTMRSDVIPGNISFERVMIEYQIRAQNVNLMQINNNNRPRFNFILSNRSNGNIMHTTNEIIINADSTVQIISGTVEIPINGNNINNSLGVAFRLQGIRQSFLNYTEGINLINRYVLVPEDNYRVNLEKQPLVISSYSLEQNYPNPFNPATQIKYSIPNDGYVVLKVFDILGREVAILINESKPAGIYEVEFNASNLSSGIYFYSISTNAFHQVKKMLLIK